MCRDRFEADGKGEEKAVEVRFGGVHDDEFLSDEGGGKSQRQKVVPFIVLYTMLCSDPISPHPPSSSP